MNKYFTKEVRIALSVIVCIIVLFVGMNFLKGIIVLSDDNSYRVVMPDINGLSASSPVYADGYKVGVVRDIAYDYAGDKGGITVTIDVDNNLRVPAGSTAEVAADLMGNLKLNLLLANNPRQRIEPGGVIPGNCQTGMMDEVGAMIPQIKALLPKLDSILTGVNALLADPAMAAMLHNAEAATSNLKTSTAELNTLMASLNRTAPGLLTKADRTLANTETLTRNLSEIDVAATMASINATLAGCKELTTRLNSKDGTIGRLISDPSLYVSLNTTMQSADSLLNDLRQHPKRYVHFSLFGKKDK